MDKLPERGELVQLDFVRRERHRGKACKCTDISYIIDDDNMTVHCGTCDARIEPFLALSKLADRDKQRNDAMERLYAQAEELHNYRPHLKIIKMLEGYWRRKEVVPICPSCSEPFLLDELTSWVGRKFAMGRINKRINEKE